MYKQQKNALTKYTPGEVQRHTQQRVDTQLERATLHSTKSMNVKTDAQQKNKNKKQQGKHIDDTSK